jgi:hypothetical protein
MQSYGPLKLQESQLWEFRDSHFEVPRQNDIWVMVLWPGVNHTDIAMAGSLNFLELRYGYSSVVRLLRVFNNFVLE